jgi:high-affinity K+ transport system ATPase subunit B
MKLFDKWVWRFYFIVGLLTWIMFVVIMAAQIINHGCHNYNTQTQIILLLDIIFTGIAYAFMNKEEDKDAKPIQGNKERLKIK